MTVFHRNITNENLLNDVCRVSRLLKLATMTQAQYRVHGCFNPTTIAARFNGWNAALVAAGLKPSRHFRVPANVVLIDIQKVAADLKSDHLLLTQYESGGLYSTALIYRHFGTWSGALKAARLAPSSYRPKASDRALFQNIEQLWQHLGRQPRCTELYPPLSTFSLTPYQSRFGGWQNALKAFIQYIAFRSTKQSGPPIHPDHPLPKIVQHKTLRTISWRLRFEVLKRDHYRCQACGRSPATCPNVVLHIDHIHPWSHGGETVIENLQTLCRTCNSGKSDLPWNL